MAGLEDALSNTAAQLADACSERDRLSVQLADACAERDRLSVQLGHDDASQWGNAGPRDCQVGTPGSPTGAAAGGDVGVYNDGMITQQDEATLAASRAELERQVAELTSSLCISEEERATAAIKVSELRRELAERQLALSGAQRAAEEAAMRVDGLASQLEELRREMTAPQPPSNATAEVDLVRMYQHARRPHKCEAPRHDCLH